MDDIEFQSKQNELDAELDALASNTLIGVSLGYDLYAEFRRRGLLKPKTADMSFAHWTLPSYRGYFVCDAFDFDGDSFKVGKP